MPGIDSTSPSQDKGGAIDRVLHLVDGRARGQIVYTDDN
jgi:hypothetical protein